MTRFGRITFRYLLNKCEFVCEVKVKWYIVLYAVYFILDCGIVVFVERNNVGSKVHISDVLQMKLCAHHLSVCRRHYSIHTHMTLTFHL